MEVDYLHEMRVRRDSWFMRLYCWAWEARAEDVDFCKLFWGYVGMPFNLLARGIGAPFYYLLRGPFGAISRWQRARSKDTRTMDEVRADLERRRFLRRQREARREKRREMYERFFARLGTMADRVVGFIQSAWRFVKYPVFAVATLIGLAALALVAWGIYLVVTTALMALVIVLSIVGGVVLAIFLIGGSIYVVEETETGERFATGVKDNLHTFGSAMQAGLIGIKSRTCPKIILADEKEKAK